MLATTWIQPFSSRRLEKGGERQRWPSSSKYSVYGLLLAGTEPGRIGAIAAVGGGGKDPTRARPQIRCGTRPRKKGYEVFIVFVID